MNTVSKTLCKLKCNMNCCIHFLQGGESWFQSCLNLAFSFFPWIFTLNLCWNPGNLPASPHAWFPKVRKATFLKCKVGGSILIGWEGRRNFISFVLRVHFVLSHIQWLWNWCWDDTSILGRDRAVGHRVNVSQRVQLKKNSGTSPVVSVVKNPPPSARNAS